MLDASSKDILNPWAGIASGILAAQELDPLLTRLSQIALLIYWTVYISKDTFLFSQVMLELLRSKYSSGGENDYMGNHWTLNVTEQIFLTIFHDVFQALLPSYFWTQLAIAVFFRLCVSGNSLFQLWTQTQLAKLLRLNAAAWLWRDWFIDTTVLSLVNRIYRPATRPLVTLLWSAVYKIPAILTDSVTDSVTSFLLITYFIGSGANDFNLLIISRLMTWRLLLQDLCKFANPDPSKYKYLPLNKPEDIRLILLYPRLGFGNINCSLIQGRHMHLFFYEAISYRWYGLEETEPIIIDGCKKHITKSVYDILASRSSLFLPRLLWIDALCIDQNNNAEKSQQVVLMEKIYLNALFTTVILADPSSSPEHQEESGRLSIPARYDNIWPENKDTTDHVQAARLAFDLLKELHVLKEKALRGSNMRTYRLFEELGLSTAKRRQWAAYSKLLQQPWFERVWVIQEIAFAPRVQVKYYGEVIDWELLIEGVKKLKQAKDFFLWLELQHSVPMLRDEHTGLSNILRMNKFRKHFRKEGLLDLMTSRSSYSREYFGLSGVLANSVHFQASNPRDLIFGLMSMCEAPQKTDYAVSVRDVYVNVAKELVQGDGVRLLLHIAGLGNRVQSDPSALTLPSWVPDWTSGPRYDRLQNAHDWRRTGDFNAGGGAKFSPTITDADSLRVSGICVDEIGDIGPACFDYSRHAGEWIVDEMQLLATSYHICLEMVKNSPATTDLYRHTKTHQSLLEAFRRTFFANRHHVTWGISGESLLGMFPSWESNLDQFRDGTRESFHANKESTYTLLYSMETVTETIKAACGGRRLFVSRKGRLGLCPPRTMKGDLIYVVPGVHAPILVRRTAAFGAKANRKPVEFVGESYVHGLMDGEALSMDVPRDILELI